MPDLRNKATDSVEFETLYRDYKARFVAVAVNYVRDAAVAEDIVSDSFLLYLENKDKLKDRSNIPGYIAVIVKNRCLNWLKQQMVHAKVEQNIHTTQQRVLLSGINSLERINSNQIFEQEIVEIIDKQLATIPEISRVVFTASRYENKSHKEIAEENDISCRKVNEEINKALIALRKALKDYLPFLITTLAVNYL